MSKSFAAGSRLCGIRWQLATQAKRRRQGDPSGRAVSKTKATPADDPVQFGEPGVGHPKTSLNTDLSLIDLRLVGRPRHLKEGREKSRSTGHGHAPEQGRLRPAEPVGKMIRYYEVTKGLTHENRPSRPAQLVSRDGAAGDGQGALQGPGGT